MFSAPLWLFGLAALAIPLILHLWSRRPREVIRVGSLRHVETGADARSWSARLTDPLLLLLRLALLTVIVLALAGLRLPARRLGGSAARLVLIEPALLDSSLGLRSPLLDSLAREYETVRLLSPGLPKVRLDGSRKSQVASHKSPATGDWRLTNGIWDALAEADALVGPAGTIDVIARPRVAGLIGRRPSLRARVNWFVPSPEVPREWTADQWIGLGDTVVSLTGQGGSAGVAYSLNRSPPSGNCAQCAPLGMKRIAVRVGDDSVARRHVGIALAAIGEELGQQVSLVEAIDSADAVVTTAPLNDSLLGFNRPLLTVSATTVREASLADSLWAQWPWPVLHHDLGDPRLAAVAQALPFRTLSPEPVRGDSARTRRGLLLLARWLATQPGRRRV